VNIGAGISSNIKLIQAIILLKTLCFPVSANTSGEQRYYLNDGLLVIGIFNHISLHTGHIPGRA
jgi:hypothetical protein